MSHKSIIVNESRAGERLDFFLATEFADYSRNYFSNLVETGNVLVNEQKSKPAHKIKNGEKIEINFINPTKPKVSPENIKLDIIYEDKNVIVINKKPGMVVHPAAGNYEGTLVNALLFYFPDLKKAIYDKNSEISQLRPGLVHRLDKDTSGVLIVAKNPKAMHSLSRQIQNRTVQKKYIAVCYGWPKEEKGEIVSFLGRHPKNRKLIAEVSPEKGKEAVSFYKVLKFLTDNESNKYSLIEFDIKTGRTHQIRVQAQKIGNPVMGDIAYGNKDSMKLSSLHSIKRQLLHAKSLKISLLGDNKPTTFTTPIPKDFKEFLSKLSEAKF